MLFNQTLTYISLFSGAGVGCYGLLEEGFECVATNEILEKRLNIQRINRKCKLDESYISGDIKKPETKEKILKQIGFYSKKFGNDRVDLVVATPPCQGMSVANHKKKNDEIKRNSLVVESVDLIKQIKPRFFILENVPSFYKTGCIDKNDNLLEIGSMIEQNLSGDYMLYDEVINFKNFGANSSRTRTLVIGVCKEFKDFTSALEFFPDFKQEKTLKEVIGSLKPLSWGEYDSADFYHSFRTYPKHMQEWIKDLKEGQSAFENTELNKKPHRIVGNKIVLNVSKNGDKYKRQKYHSVAPCIHTRNDQMASQNTIHPKDDRVFSIRELMLLMNIPSRFKWLDLELQELNALNQQEKEKISKQNEMNIRQSIGEAVPTIIFKQIAIKIKNFMSQTHLEPKEIIRLIDVHHLLEPQNLKRFILENQNKIARASLVSLAEMSNSKRIEKSAYFTNPFIINEIAKLLPSFKQESVTIIEPSAGCGNFLSALFKKYTSVKKVYLKCIDIDKNSLEILEILYKDCIPNNFEMELICKDFLAYECGKVECHFKQKDNLALITELLNLDLFPIKDSYMAYLKRDKSALERNPRTINRICGRLYEMGLNKIFEKCSEPKETNRQIGPMFKDWLNNKSLGVEPVDLNDFIANENDAILRASDNIMAEFAKSHLNYHHHKGLDFVARFNKKYIIGEAKFLTDFGGHQNAQFNDAISTIETPNIKAIKVAILDGVLYIESNNKMRKLLDTTYRNYNIMSALVLREFLYQI